MPSKHLKSKDGRVTKRKPVKNSGRTLPAKLGDTVSDGTDDEGEGDMAESKFFSEGNGTKRTRSTCSKKKLDDEEEYQDDEEEHRRSGKKIYDSDALDEDSDFEDDADEKKRKRKLTTRSSPNKSRSPKKRKTKDEDEDDYDDDLPEGTEVVGKVVLAPSTGRVPPGQISQNTLDFLNDLKKPECNDRQWFKLHEPVYRQAEQEWKDFVEAFTDLLIEVDSQIPHLPPKDVIHRIYRDMRFSNDKTPYKKAFSASFSRSGRKGIFAGCTLQHMQIYKHVLIYIFRSYRNNPTSEQVRRVLPRCLDATGVTLLDQVQPGKESIIAAGTWCPGRNELLTIRNPRRLRSVISLPDFVKYFGKPEPHPKGEKQNIFGQEGELKTAPKGVDKDHKDIDLLKCRSFCVFYRFSDSEVLSSDFRVKLATIAQVLQPFVHCLNDMMTIMGTDNDDDEEHSGED
ncbi:unnamed protein product [Cyclocybe aegerita]|uniref:Uncharacterized protein n=1 Tax=Cyclocybe aegerita TaxID=1973307 RepID=A0A8S0XIC5_CYCAE|nr:unnamed protein product [Cyclocybe aegerita]